jgi:hypothetical protein
VSKKLPLEIQRNYSIKDKGPEWHLSCIVCSKAWKLQKPGKGEKIHGGNILHLLDHAASHPLAEEAAEAAPSEPVVELVPESSPNSHIGPVTPPSKLKYGYPSERHPNAYKVEVQGGVTKVSNFRDVTYTKYLQAEKLGGGYSVILFAANSKHASLIGQRIIERHTNESKKE